MWATPENGFAFALCAGRRMAVRRSRSAVRPAALVGTKKAQRLWLCFQPVLLSFPLERPIFLREYATVWMRTCERADGDPWNMRHGCVATGNAQQARTTHEMQPTTCSIEHAHA